MPIVTVLPDGRMSPKDAATYLGLSVKTLAMKRCDGTGPAFIKLGRIFYFQRDLDFWVNRTKLTSTAQSRVGASDVCVNPALSGD